MPGFASELLSVVMITAALAGALVIRFQLSAQNARPVPVRVRTPRR